MKGKTGKKFSNIDEVSNIIETFRKENTTLENIKKLEMKRWMNLVQKTEKLAVLVNLQDSLPGFGIA